MQHYHFLSYVTSTVLILTATLADGFYFYNSDSSSSSSLIGKQQVSDSLKSSGAYLAPQLSNQQQQQIKQSASVLTQTQHPHIRQFDKQTFQVSQQQTPTAQTQAPTIATATPISLTPTTNSQATVINAQQGRQPISRHQESLTTPRQLEITPISTTTIAATTTTTTTSTTTTPSPTSTTTSTTTSAPSTTSATTTLPSPSINFNAFQSGQNTRQALQEAEAEAMASIKATMAFDEQLPSQLADSCYDDTSRPKYCEPEFENIALERQVDVSSECGSPRASRFCLVNERNEKESICHMCNAAESNRKHPAAYLTDINHPNKPTCWVSAPLIAQSSFAQSSFAPPTSASALASSSPSAATPRLLSSSNDLDKHRALSENSIDDSLASSGAGVGAKSDDVTLTLNFDKAYEVSYVSLQFCGQRPDSMRILKSSDYGKKWIPFQFYSSQCAEFYNLDERSVARNDVEPLCANPNNSSSASRRVAFSTLDGRGGATQLDHSASLQQWVTATNIKIILDRQVASRHLLRLHQRHLQSQNQSLQQSHSQSYAAALRQKHAHRGSHQTKQSSTKGLLSIIENDNNNNNDDDDDDDVEDNIMTNTNEFNSTSSPSLSSSSSLSSIFIDDDENNSLAMPSDSFNYAIADLAIGGRCKCNGHASRCISDKRGRLRCDCRHNTAGRDCDKCAAFHIDRPWQRATRANANACQPCNCNGHSRKCKFSPARFRASNGRSGGVCRECKHNTAGKNCHLCARGFKRDPTRPLSDKEACRACGCHESGSLSAVCDQTSGQCACKQGVTGTLCNQCAPGYTMSTVNGDEEPCVRIADATNSPLPSATIAGQGSASDGIQGLDSSTSTSGDNADGNAMQNNNDPFAMPGGAQGNDGLESNNNDPTATLTATIDNDHYNNYHTSNNALLPSPTNRNTNNNNRDHQRHFNGQTNNHNNNDLNDEQRTENMRIKVLSMLVDLLQMPKTNNQ